jgi:hypothetical protein
MTKDSPKDTGGRDRPVLDDHPIRTALLRLLGESGVLTANEASRRLGRSSGLCSFHLRRLAQAGVIEEVPGGGRARPWRLTAAGGAGGPEGAARTGASGADPCPGSATAGESGTHHGADSGSDGGSDGGKGVRSRDTGTGTGTGTDGTSGTHGASGAGRAPREDSFSCITRGLEDESYRRWLDLRPQAPAAWRDRDEAFSSIVYLTPSEIGELADEVRALLRRFQHREWLPEHRPEGTVPVAVISRLFPVLPPAVDREVPGEGARRSVPAAGAQDMGTNGAAEHGTCGGTESGGSGGEPRGAGSDSGAREAG